MFRQFLVLLFMIGALQFITACPDPDRAQIVCGAIGADSVTVIIRDAVPGDSVKGSLQCGGIEVGDCTATVAPGDDSANCDGASTADGSGLAKSCPATVVGGTPSAAQYTVSC